MGADIIYTKRGKYNNYELIKPSDLYPAINKLGKLEAIEKRFGIGLEMFVEAMEHGIFVKKADGTIEQEFFPELTFDDDLDGDRCYEPMFLCKNVDWTDVYLKDINNTWALTEEALK